MSKRQTSFLLGILLLASGLVRLYDITDEPLEVHPTRQMRAGLVARAFYYPSAPDIDPEKVEFAASQIQVVGVIEPPIQEFLTAQLYKIAGGEALWLGRTISIFFWLLGGWALYSLATQLGTQIGGWAALVYYLFLPFGVRFSRTLLPDPMMVALTIISLWALVTWQKQRTFKSALVAGLITGFTILTKSVAGIILILPFTAYILSTNSLKQAIRDRQIWLIFILAALPSAGYYYWGLVLDGRLATQFNGRFFPELWTDLLLYKSWGKRIIIEFGLFAFVIGIAGIFLTRNKPVRHLIFFWWAGYFIYGMLFAYHIMTHDYYHLPMVPLLAVSLSLTVSWLEDFSRKKGYTKATTLVAVLTLLIFIGFGTASSIRFVDQIDFRKTRDAYFDLAETLDQLPPAGIVALTDDYETSFRYYTFRNARHWPHLGDLNYFQLSGSDQEDIDVFWEKIEGANYFLVADWKELDRQTFLADQLSPLPVLYKDNLLTLYHLTP